MGRRYETPPEDLISSPKSAPNMGFLKMKLARQRMKKGAWSLGALFLVSPLDLTRPHVHTGQVTTFKASKLGAQ